MINTEILCIFILHNYILEDFIETAKSTYSLNCQKKPLKEYTFSKTLLQKLINQYPKSSRENISKITSCFKKDIEAIKCKSADHIDSTFQILYQKLLGMPTFDSVLVAISLAELFLTTTNHMPSTAKLILNQLPISNTSVHQLESALPTSLQSKDLSTPRVIETNDENSSPSNHSNNQILKTELRRKIYEKSYYNILQGNNIFFF